MPVFLEHSSAMICVYQYFKCGVGTRACSGVAKCGTAKCLALEERCSWQKQSGNISINLFVSLHCAHSPTHLHYCSTVDSFCLSALCTFSHLPSFMLHNLGWHSTLKRLQLINVNVNDIQSQLTSEHTLYHVQMKFPTLFRGVGGLRGEHIIELKKNSIPYSLNIPGNIAELCIQI